MKKYHKTKPTEKIKRHRQIFSSLFPSDFSYAKKMRIKRKSYLPTKAPKGYGIISKMNWITQKRLLNQNKSRYLMRFC